MKVSCHFITWGEELLTALEEASDLGYQACETFTHLALNYEDRIEEFQELMNKYGFQLSALYGGGNFTDIEKRDYIVKRNAQVARFIKANGGDRIVFGPGGPRREGGTTLEELKIAAETMNLAAKACDEIGVKACLHPHINTEIETVFELDTMMELTDPKYVHFCPDTAHLKRGGMDPLEVIKRYSDRIAYVHLKDISPEEVDEQTFPILSGNEQMPIFCELGLGTISDEIVDIVGYLKEINYDGWLTVEIDKSTSTPYKSLEICRNFVQNRLKLEL
ncbi:TIM barrel protein [Gracilibacillus salitolerans]|uniref:TIM barrel protein n=1 Tax=Gracilibacillus salitolerans TaxID=2663022 RepID=A0A5Q2THN8_9BACI|nr:sugar phosphate isomerase/epimerase [Gracilibacillus salitolerans]QGH33661.1 TIM barrel protein [Gracilibacillus salitolerans]